MSSPKNLPGNVRSDMDIVYPDHLSLYHHSVLSEYPKCQRIQKKNMRNRRGNRYRTQPVTFDEIQEVDEDAMAEEVQLSEVEARGSCGNIPARELKLGLEKLSTTLQSICKTQCERDRCTTPTSTYAVDTVDRLQTNAMNMAKEKANWTNKSRKGSL